jgi:hypothetical protein
MRETIPNFSNGPDHLQYASGDKNTRRRCKMQVVFHSDVFVQGILLIAGLKIPMIVNLHRASSVIGQACACSTLRVGRTE